MLCAAPSGAQSVGGVVTERISGAGVPGVVVTLERLDARSADPAADGNRSVLTTTGGDYQVLAPGAGRYRISAKRIGVRRFTSAPFVLGDGETRRLDIVIDAVGTVLPTIAVRTIAVCGVRRDHADRIAALWEEAFTAFLATSISQRDRLLPASIVRYRRVIDPSDWMRQLSETQQTARGAFERPFVSLSGDSLSKAGYWQGQLLDSITYVVPDVEVLASSAFVRDHCFELASDRNDHRGLVGLAFEPVADRHVPDIRGTIWLDATTFELRTVDFTYTELPAYRYASRMRGEIHFASTTDGRWIVRRWFARLPQPAAYLRRSKLESGEVRVDTVRSGNTVLIEDGGVVSAEGLSIHEARGSIHGLVRDSSGTILPGAEVHLTGVGVDTTTIVPRSAAAFFDSLPPGVYLLSVRDASYEAFESFIAAERIILDAGVTLRRIYRAKNTAELARDLCRAAPPGKGRAMLRLAFRDSATAVPVDSLEVRVVWAGAAGTGPAAQDFHASGTTDERGVVTFCELPSGTPLDMIVRHGTGPERRLPPMTLTSQAVVGQVIRLSAPDDRP